MLSINQKRRRKSVASKSSGTEIKKVSGRRRDGRHTSQRHERLQGMPHGSTRCTYCVCVSGHQRLCEACANEVERLGRGYPICRTDIQMILRLFWRLVATSVHWQVDLTDFGVAYFGRDIFVCCRPMLFDNIRLLADSYTTNNTWNLYIVSLVRYH